MMWIGERNKALSKLHLCRPERIKAPGVACVLRPTLTPARGPKKCRPSLA